MFSLCYTHHCHYSHTLLITHPSQRAQVLAIQQQNQLLLSDVKRAKLQVNKREATFNKLKKAAACSIKQKVILWFFGFYYIQIVCVFESYVSPLLSVCA